MASKIVSKGTALLMEISSVYTAIPQVTSIDISGEKGETYDSVTLDGGVFKTKNPTGYVEPCTIKFDMFYDMGNVVHQAYTSFVAAPPAAGKNFKVTYADSGPTSVIYPGVTGGIDKKVDPAMGVKASCEVVTSGAPS